MRVNLEIIAQKKTAKPEKGVGLPGESLGHGCLDLNKNL
jgi:hypothetical protein